MTAFDQAWDLVKAPIVDTPLDNLQMIHHEYPGDFPDKVGSQPPNWTMHRDSNVGVTTVEQMSPNEYFDYIRDGMVITNEFSEPVGDAEDEWRWNQHEDSKKYINQLADRLRSGEKMTMGMPSLQMQGDENYWQEGGHRMEALRQIGHGDSKFPVLVARKEHNTAFDRIKRKYMKERFGRDDS